MHEHKLAGDMVASLLKTMGQAGGVRVARVTVELSELGGESEHALRHGFQEKSEGTAVEGAELVVRTIGPKLRCGDCRCEVNLRTGSGRTDPPDKCPSCGGGRLLIVPQPALVIRDVEIELPDG